MEERPHAHALWGTFGSGRRHGKSCRKATPKLNERPCRDEHADAALENVVAREGHGDMKAVWRDTVIAESPDTMIVEGNHYFPLASVNAALLEPSTHTSVCPWKGTANYYSLKVGDQRNENAVWYYAEPKEAARQIKGRVAFWKGVSVVP
jgi:uncharacterized protein (DUF427 family)